VAVAGGGAAARLARESALMLLGLRGETRNGHNIDAFEQLFGLCFHISGTLINR